MLKICIQFGEVMHNILEFVGLLISVASGF